MIAIVVNTFNRPKEYALVMEHINKFQPQDSYIISVKDGGGEDYNLRGDTWVKSLTRLGIPHCKNIGLRQAIYIDADYIFLFDDDVYPIVPNWHKPYIDSGLNHASYTFTTGFAGTPAWGEGRRVGNIMFHEKACGCMMFLTREVLNTVGGFDEEFGMGKYCDTEYQRRIFNAGLTPHPFLDVVGSDKLFHSMDEHGEIKRTFTGVEQSEMLINNRAYFDSRKYSKDFIEFRI